MQPNGLALPSVAVFDPWNSASTGHQRPETNTNDTAWKTLRNLKLGLQYKSESRSSKDIRNPTEDGKENLKASNGSLNSPNTKRQGRTHAVPSVNRRKTRESTTARPGQAPQSASLASHEHSERSEKQPPAKKQLFASLTFYINGSTAPLISDHKLKYLIAERGGRLSIALGRRTVTHVVLGTTSSGGGAGGGLAGGKIQKEIARVRGKGVKFVSAEWVVECIRQDKRLSEAAFAKFSTAPCGQKSVLAMFGQAKPGSGVGAAKSADCG